MKGIFMETKSAMISKDLYYIGVNDRSTPLFENMWPLDNGVTYNSYIFTGKKNIILDLVSAIKFDDYLENIRNIIGEKPIDYVIINHLEPDHSSCIIQFLNVYPDVKFIGNKKTLEFLGYMYQIGPSKMQVVADGESLTLGDRTLTFYTTPMVHWPESMVTYEEATHTLFSQDAFGGFGALDGSVFDDELNWNFHEFDTRRYYTNIVGKFSSQVQVALEKLAPLKIDVICPIHGVVWRKNPAKIVELYDSLSKYDTKEGCVIVYGSMYGHAASMAEHFGKYLASFGIKNVKIYDVSRTHPSYILTDIWKYKGLALASCSYNNGLYPPMQNLMDIVASNKLKNHTLCVFGTYGWSGGGVKNLVKLPELGGKYDFIDYTVEARFAAKKEDYENLKKLAGMMAEKVKA